MLLPLLLPLLLLLPLRMLHIMILVWFHKNTAQDALLDDALSLLHRRSLGRSSKRYPHWATAHRETTRWFAERYNTVTTQSTVPNKDGVAWPLLLL